MFSHARVTVIGVSSDLKKLETALLVRMRILLRCGYLEDLVIISHGQFRAKRDVMGLYCLIRIANLAHNLTLYIK